MGSLQIIIQTDEGQIVLRKCPCLTHLSMSSKSHVLTELKGPRRLSRPEPLPSLMGIRMPREVATSLGLQPQNSHPGSTVLGWPPALACMLLAQLTFCTSFWGELKYQSSWGSFADPSQRSPRKLCPVPVFCKL